MALQVLLRSLGFFPTTLTPTTYFGLRTAHAVLLFQDAHTLEKTAIFDTSTQILMNKVPPPNPPTASSSFTRYLGLGMTGSDVTSLQQLLITDNDYPEGIISGYYGSLTQRAVQSYQSKYGIVNTGSPSTTGFGALGPKTRASMNGR
jgi:peptidoglycan hydrolase-like protein with peptidoglycan-binding domain